MARPEYRKEVRAPREFEESVLEINRISRTVSGGRRIRFRVLLAIGNMKGKVGIGIGKAPDIADAVKKARLSAEKHLIEVPLRNGTIPCEVLITYGASKIVLKPAVKGKSILAGSSVRTVVALAGIENISAKILGSNNKVNNAKAMMVAFKTLKEIGDNIDNRHALLSKTVKPKGKKDDQVSQNKKTK